MANIGTTITPWQVFFQQSAVVDKGMDIKDITLRADRHVRGSAVTCIVAAFIIIATAAVFYYHPSAARSTSNRQPRPRPGCPRSCRGARRVVGQGLFAVGLFDAGLLGALCISFATSWALGEVFGWAHSLNKSVREAPWFYVAYLLMLCRPAWCPWSRARGFRMRSPSSSRSSRSPYCRPDSSFLILLLNDKPLMGEHVNTRRQNMVNWSITVFVIAVSTASASRYSSRSCSDREERETMNSHERAQTIRRRRPPRRTPTISFFFSPSC